MSAATATQRRRARPVIAAVILATVAVIGSATSTAQEQPAEMDDLVRLNEIQTIGSHNSYHLMPEADEEELLRAVGGDIVDSLQYEHRPLPIQFASQKVRQIELDVFLDSQGGKYADPLIREVAGKGQYRPDVMNDPGPKVLHVQDIDYSTTCATLQECLQEVRRWSEANGEHVPIAVLLELKDTPFEFGDFEFELPEPFDTEAMDELDSVIRSVFPDDQVITPDDVRGDHGSLEEAVLAGEAWPTLAESRGKVLFLMDNGGTYRDLYVDGHPNLEDRMLFTNSEPGEDDAAFIKMNDPTEPIAERVEAGYIVRTRADGDTEEARANDTTKRDTALASGAQWVSTDYPMPDMAIGFESSYVAQIPGGHVARCNPVNAPDDCVSEDLDTIWSPEPEEPGPQPEEPGGPQPEKPEPADPVGSSPSYTG